MGFYHQIHKCFIFIILFIEKQLTHFMGYSNAKSAFMIRAWVFVGLSQIIPFIAADSVFSEPRPLDEIVVTGSHFPYLLSETGHSVSIISREDIEILPASTLSELLDMIGGVDVRQRGVSGSQTDISIWGSSFEQVLILVDGVNMSDAQTGHNMMNLPVLIDDIERIEILKGPGARTYGQNAMAGVINIITRSSEQPSAKVQLSYGSYDYYQIQGRINCNTGGLSNRLSIHRQATDGHIADKPTDFQTNTFSYKGELNHSNHNLQFGASLSDKNFGAYKFYSNVYPDQRENTRTSILYANDQFSLSNVDIRSGLFWRRNEDVYSMLLGNTLFINDTENNSTGFQLDSKFTSGFGTSALGGEIAHEDIESINLGDHDRNRYGLFFEHQVNFAHHFLFGFGTSALHYTDWGWQCWPGANINIRVVKGLNLFSSVGKSFRIPTYTELYYFTPANQGNPDLKPEEAWTYEAGLVQQTKGLRTQATLFIRDIENIIDWTRSVPTDPWQVRNIAEVKTRGYELEMEVYPGLLADILHNILISLSYTYIDTNRTTEGFESKYALDHLKHQAKGFLTIDWSKSFAQSVVIRYEKRLNKAPYVVVDSRITCTWDRFKYYLDISNIFNKNFISNGFAPDPGRWLVVGVSYETQILK